jgi:hypothetical protein
MFPPLLVATLSRPSLRENEDASLEAMSLIIFILRRRPTHHRAWRADFDFWGGAVLDTCCVSFRVDLPKVT